MLVLTRQRGEVVMIGDDIEITVVDIRGASVRLGIVVDGMPIHRKEIWISIKAEAAVVPDTDDSVQFDEDFEGERR